MSTSKVKFLKPYDIVKYQDAIGFIDEVSPACDDNDPANFQYSVTWFASANKKCAWFDFHELEYIDNMLFLIAEASCHPSGNNKRSVRDLIETNRNVS